MPMQRVREPLAKARKTGVIPPKRNRTEQRDYDRDLYKTRHLIEKALRKAQTIQRPPSPATTRLILLILSGIHLAAALI